MKASKVAYKPVGLALSAISGIVAGAVFKQVWKFLSHDGKVLDATDRDVSWQEAVAAATLHGAIYAGVRAAVDRSGASAMHRLSGSWPD